MDAIKETQAEVRSLKQTAVRLEKQKESLEAQVSKQKNLLAEAQSLQSQGFDFARLSELGAILSRTGEAEGVGPDVAAERLLAFAKDHKRLTRAKAEADAAQEKAKAALATAKLDGQALEIARWWASQRIPAKTALAERKIAMKLKLPFDVLADRLSEALEQFGTLEAACRAKEKEKAALAAEGDRIRAENAALKKEQRRIQSAIEAVSKAGSGSIAKIEEQAASAIRKTCTTYLDSIEEELCGRHVRGTFGVLRGLKLDKEPEEDEMACDVCGGPLLMELHQWNSKKRRYGRAVISLPLRYAHEGAP